MTRFFFWVAVAAVLAYLAWLGFLWAEQGRILYPGATLHPQPPQVLPGEQRTWLRTPFGASEAWYLAPDTPTVPSPAIIFAHGNGETIDSWPSEFEGFRQRGFGVLLVEYPGFGRSTGKPSERSISQTFLAGYDYLASLPGVDANRIIAFGQSLGGGAVCTLLPKRRLAGVVLLSTFPSLRIFASRYWAPSFLLQDTFDNVAALKQFAGPVLIIHGTRDDLIPFSTVEALRQAAPQASFRAYPCAHWCWNPDELPFWSDFDTFIQSNHLASGKRTPVRPVIAADSLRSPLSLISLARP
jgi:pimeloyl-ACP methyl ester carboxylesterase